MASMTQITCKCGCGRTKMVRTADVQRGWGVFFSKSCKAKEQERRTGQYKGYMRHGMRIWKQDAVHHKGYGHLHVSGDEGHGQE